MEPIQFLPIHAFIDPALWAELSRRRLDDWQLECPLVDAHGSCSIYNQTTVNESTLLLNHDALMSNAEYGRDIAVRGRLRLFGTLKEFQQLDPKQILSELAAELWNNITSDDAFQRTSALNIFYLTAFADVKNYVYYYAMYTPALLFPSNLLIQKPSRRPDASIHKQLLERFNSSKSQRPFLRLSDGKLVELAKLSDLDDNEDVALVFADPSNIVDVPGWPLRNLLALIAFRRPQRQSINVISLRGTVDQSSEYKVGWDAIEQLSSAPKAVGVSKPKSVNLKSAFDPIKLMENSVDMNLKLVRWRLVPSLKLAAFSELRVLLLGAGTLGCNLARSLLGWGIRTFTFVDNAIISYNNPVRQVMLLIDS